MVTIAQLARIKRVFDEMDIRDIPVSEDPKKLAEAFVMGVCTNEKLHNEFFEIVTGEKKDYYNMGYAEVIELAVNFFKNMDSQLQELIGTMLKDRKTQLLKEVESTQQMMREMM